MNLEPAAMSPDQRVGRRGSEQDHRKPTDQAMKLREHLEKGGAHLISSAPSDDLPVIAVLSGFTVLNVPSLSIAAR